MSRLDHKATLRPAQGFPVRCCFAALILQQYWKNLPVRFGAGLFGKCGPHLRFSQPEHGPALRKPSDEPVASGASQLRPGTLLGVRDSLPGFLQRQQDVFPMFHEVLRGPFPPRVLPFLAAVLFQRKERKNTGFYHWRVRQIPVLSEMEFLSRGARERLPLAARVENHCGPSAGIKKFIVSQAFLLMVMLMEI